MSFDLRITFTGMCLFAPDPSSPRMHVLLPKIDHDEHKHYSYLIYDAAHEARGAKQLSRRLVYENMEGYELRLPVLTAKNADLNLPDEIPNLDALFGPRQLSREWIQAKPGTDLASRIALDAGCVTDYEEGAVWTLVGTSEQLMTWRVQWTIRNIDKQAMGGWFLSRFDGTSPRQLKTLYPIGETVHVFVHNVMCADLPPADDMDPPDPGFRATHFGWYYPLFKTTKKDPVPILQARRPQSSGIQLPCRESTSQSADNADIQDDCKYQHNTRARAEPPPHQTEPGGRPYTCMVAQASLA